MLASNYTLSLSLLYAGFKRVETWWNFKDVISPFYRLYYIKRGEGCVYMNQTSYKLSAGQLFLIPKFVFHSYECDGFMEHYYICFFDDLSGRVGIRNPLCMNLQILAGETDYSLIKRYMELNPDKSLPNDDPRRYDNDRNLYNKQSDTNFSRFSYDMESDGILLQLLSRFVTRECMQNPFTNNSYEKLNQIVHYIDKNLDKRIRVTDLADIMCVTCDHCSRIFKKITGMSPCEYIQIKRIQRAQTLMLTTQLSFLQIAEKIGIGSSSQFSHLFSKVTKCSPYEYRIMQLENPENKYYK